jgi:hypothetical protein
MIKLQDIGKVDWSSFDVQTHKYINIKKKFEYPKEVQDILNIMLLYTYNNYKFMVFDFKVRNLIEGQCSCIFPQWHYDCVRKFDHPSRHENHLVYSNIYGTEFLNPDFSITQAGDSELWNYGRELHRGTRVPVECKRVIIRLTETDYL